nr:hypothetical protein [uncultured Clostridium sp.]
MSKKESDGKVYLVYKDRDNHVNTKVNEEGRKSALQFDDKGNKLNGPVELEEVDIDEELLFRCGGLPWIFMNICFLQKNI